MDPRLIALAGRQGGVFTRSQALAAGHTARSIRTLTQPGGEWRLVRRGVYAERSAWEALEKWTALPLAFDWAAHLTMREQHVMSHHSAGRAYGLSLLRPRRDLVHITRPGVGGCRSDHGVKHHLSQGLPWVSTFSAGLPVTNLARVPLDIAREEGLWSGVAAVDSARRRGVTLDDLHRSLGPMRQWPYVNTSRSAVALGDPGAENAGETMARLLVLESISGTVLTQYPLQLADGRTVWVDLIVGNHVIEFDGKHKYVRSEPGATRANPGEIVWLEKERQRLICAEGLGMSRVIWSDFWGSARKAAQGRLAAEASVTRERFGGSRPAHLEEFAARMALTRARRMRDWRGVVVG